ncbi:MAG: hypothetical protein A3F26_03235 [Candidatus Ryanbacteria bacterium RIFCSPHIGHO2_12_FULL_47_12b]|uniref:Uncharacterized protein n=2 Tax=Candidatus Ryaniibacteriota TaxID=1817914 RepID=A0A1G2H3A4_9BACT|nr:MAG: hypothetical protein UX74_C0031G0022 [Parcubacteria group bacterium GW2011_GWA2_47_10b]KKU85642.1 MAG: hypothetical protein UY14_C0017G0005 [Parcubacteria group bacterium GW2011_GWA1_47_9]OGZ46395.1 MAG: hypothetical protein A2844_01435 [Candidatus Ryanbacteria bacterium RIFCSPHIGHO2_01_FULL_48_80]OGZ49628.1 MAG: hypothetical protein A3C83_01140 [Candidatus Ryanbacteria bacterium RIFCSPHIGHO2_02_FULL_47_25]OGZ52312.1 MAG: hypothetical protein A3F26_03235 [Candidatus Ryanbacteria bacteri
MKWNQPPYGFLWLVIIDGFLYIVFSVVTVDLRNPFPAWVGFFIFLIVLNIAMYLVKRKR